MVPFYSSSPSSHSQLSSSSSSLQSSYTSALLLLIIVVISSLCLTETEAAPAENPYRAFKRYNFVNNANRINRRGFKSSLLSTARGFGKRSGGAAAAQASVGDHELGNEIPTVLLPEEAAENPSRIFGLLASLLDANQDGMISGEEVARAQEMALARRRRGELQ